MLFFSKIIGKKRKLMEITEKSFPLRSPQEKHDVSGNVPWHSAANQKNLNE